MNNHTKNGDKMRRILSRIRIPLEDIHKDVELNTHGKIISVTSKEQCFTCGRHKRLRFNQRIDGKLYRIDECLYCLVRVKTHANRQVN